MATVLLCSQSASCFRCECNACQGENRELDRLTRAKSRLAAWKALTSEAYISLSTSDPILAAFLTSHDVSHVSRQEVQYKVIILETMVIVSYHFLSCVVKK